MKKYRPSNGSEGEMFIGHWCGTCTKDLCANGTKSVYDCTDDELCMIVAKTHALDVDDDEYPNEWVYGENGPCCTAHDPFTDPIEKTEKIMDKKFAQYSQLDSRGKPVIDCSECERGGNGSDKDKCSCGWKIIQGGHGSCFCGTLLNGLMIKP